MRVAKGHGTENDFVLVPDFDGALDLTPSLVTAICDRHAGLGADGVLRVVRCAAEPSRRVMAGDAEWFMDYRNADGSVAEMCGNGIRVFARWLVDAGLAAPGDLPDRHPRGRAIRTSRCRWRRERGHGPLGDALRPGRPEGGGGRRTGGRARGGSGRGADAQPPRRRLRGGPRRGGPAARRSGDHPGGCVPHRGERRVRGPPRTAARRPAGARARGGRDQVVRHRRGGA